MTATTIWPWLAMLTLGALHGINPGMGWLFAVALGLQEGQGRAVWRALLPLAAGHALAIGAVIALGVIVGLVIPARQLRWAVAAILLGFGLYRLVRNRHPRWGGMQVGAWDLTVWSFLMASAHGAGVMVLPLVLDRAIPQPEAEAMGAGGALHAAHGSTTLTPGWGEATHAGHASALTTGIPGQEVLGLLATGVHTLGYLLVTGVVAVIVYRRLGLRMLRSLWFNLDLVWAAALILTALITPLI